MSETFNNLSAASDNNGKSGAFRNPYSGSFKVTSVYGRRGDSQHGGIDLVGISSKTILSVGAGTVVRSRIVTDPSNATSEWGNYVAVFDGKHTVYYCHLSERAVSEGDKVSAGSVIGREGSTGRSTGSHLHLEVRLGSSRVNPAEFIGIDNVPGVVSASMLPPDYRALVLQKCPLEEQTVKYLSDYEYAADLWRKLWETLYL